MRVVIDCNVIISAARLGAVCGKVIVEAVRRHEIALSAPILNEYRLVAHRPKHAHYHDILMVIIDELERLAIVVEPDETLFGLSDPEDEVYLATAAAAGAVLVTGNSKDFTEPRYGSVEVFSPRGFLDRTR